MALFLLLYGSVVFYAHFLLVLRLVLLPQLPAPWAEIAIAVFALGGVALFLRPLADRFLPERAVQALSWPAFLWMGISFELLMVLLGTDMLVWLFGRAAWAMGEPATAAPITDRAQALLVAVVGLGLAGWGLVLGLGAPLLRRIAKEIPNLPRPLDGFRIVQISDVHIGPLLGRRFVASLVERINALEPDLVAVTGDLVDGKVEQLADEVEPLRHLSSRYGTFFVTGNHDYFSNVDPWVDKVRELGFRVLRNERVSVGGDGAAIELAGVDDRMARSLGHGGEDLERALDGHDPARPLILLAHNPNVFDEAAERGVDLQLSGHTHGGQIWPFGAFVRLATRYVAGEYTRGRSTLYVSRGTGFWGPPMRLFQPAEITEITLRSSH